MEIFATFGIAFWFFVIAASILLFFLPFFVLGIYSETKSASAQLKEINKTLQLLKHITQKTDPSEERMREKENDPDSIFYKGGK